MCLYASVLNVGRCAEDGFGLLLYWNAGCCETDLCMLRYWIWDAVPIWFLYASVLGVERCADLFFRGYGRILYWMRKVLRPFSVCFGVGCGALCRFFLIYCVFLHWAGCTFASILCSLRLNFQPGMWQRYGLLWRRCDTA